MADRGDHGAITQNTKVLVRRSRGDHGRSRTPITGDHGQDKSAGQAITLPITPTRGSDHAAPIRNRGRLDGSLRHPASVDPPSPGNPSEDGGAVVLPFPPAPERAARRRRRAIRHDGGTGRRGGGGPDAAA